MAKTIEERLDGQKNAIITLRRQVNTLTSTVDTLKQELADLRSSFGEAAKPEPVPVSSVTVESVPVSGNKKTATGWFMQPHCLTCGKTKEPHRTDKLSCVECGKNYIAMIRGNMPKVMITTCGWCGATKKPSLNPQCPKCAKGFQQWKGKS